MQAYIFEHLCITLQSLYNRVMSKAKPDFKKYGSKGGKKTLKKHGTKHFSRIAKLRWAKK